MDLMSEKANIFNIYCNYLDDHIGKYGPQSIVLMQVGMFHELYGVDNNHEKIGFVREISEILNIQMTRRDKKIPENSRKNFLMAGFPSVSLDRYVNILLENNYTVAIVDQITEPPNVQRAITKVYSPGTYIEECRHADNNFLLAICFRGEKSRSIGRGGKENKLLTVGLAAVDLSTGESHIYEAWSNIEDTNYALDEAYRFIQAHQPKETIIYGENLDGIVDKDMLAEFLDLQEYVCHFRIDIPKDYQKITYQNLFLRKVFGSRMGVLSPIEWLDLENCQLSVLTYVLLLQFAWEHNEKIVDKLKKPEIWDQQDHLILANNAINQLALINSGNNGGNGTGLGANSKFRSVFHIIDNTSTSMGKRLLKYRLLNPILNTGTIKQRYDLIEAMRKQVTVPSETEYDKMVQEYQFKIYEKYLNNLVDVQRFHRRLSLKMLQPCEFNTLDASYQEINKVLEMVQEDNSGLGVLLEGKEGLIDRFKKFQKYYSNVLNLPETIKKNLSEVTDSFFKVGYNPELDKISYQIRHYEQYFKLLACDFSDILIPGSSCVTLKYSETSGHYLNLTLNRYKILQKAWEEDYEKHGKKLKIVVDDTTYEVDLIADFNMEKVSKKSTSCNLFSEKMKELSDELVPLHKEIREKTTKVYHDFLEELDRDWGDLMDQIADLVAEIDVAKSGAKTSVIYHYNRPEVVKAERTKTSKPGKSFIKTTGLRHPIIERINQQVTYVPHDISIGDVEVEITGGTLDGLLVYGVNSCGKSSLMKSVGINLVMAQAGMYVAADTFKYRPYQYVLTRIIGNDNLFKGLSSFAVEMTELRGILKRANERSLVLGDEICHGTETVSAVAIVASAIRHLSKRQSSFIFATHLHQLAGMEEIQELDNVKNFHLRVFYDQKKGQLIYDRNLMPGSGDPIYGLEVAKAMQLDPDFLEEANKIRRKILDVDSEVLSTRKSHFNSGVYLDKCQVCGKDAEETHHIGFQCHADKENFIGHYHKNIMANLVPLCHGCHLKVHVGDKKSGTKLIIKGYQETSNGTMLDYCEEGLSSSTNAPLS